MSVTRHVVGLLAVAVIRSWNAVVTRTLGKRGGRPRSDPSDDPVLVEHERNWYDYLRGFDAHHGDAGDHPEHGSFWAGLDRWLESGCLRGYTSGTTSTSVRTPRASSGSTRRVTRRRSDGSSTRSSLPVGRTAASRTNRSGRST